MRGSLDEKLIKILENTGDMALKRRARKVVLGLNPQDGDKILDVGCGDGYYLYLLSNLGFSIELIGTDYDKEGLKRASLNLKKGIKLVQSDLMKKLPFLDNSFDKIVMSEVAEHLPSDLRGLKEVYRILKPGGIICLTVPDSKYPFLWDPLNWILERYFKAHVSSGFFAGIWNQHIRLYTKERITSVMKKAGFKIEDSTAVTYWSLPFNHYLINLVARVLYGGSLSIETKESLNKFKKSTRKPFLITLAFKSINLIDKLNDLYQPREKGVSIFVRASK